MARKFTMTFIGAVLASSVLLTAPSISWGAKEKNVDEAAQSVRHMEAHWQTLVRESDPERRKVLIAEHRKMMAETQAKLDAKPSTPMEGHGQKGMSEMHHYHDMQNTMELHTMMLDMMK